jgi:hypothetical protein
MADAELYALIDELMAAMVACAMAAALPILNWVLLSELISWLIDPSESWAYFSWPCQFIFATANRAASAWAKMFPLRA